MTKQNEAIRALQAAEREAWRNRWTYVLDANGNPVGRGSVVRKNKPKRVRMVHCKPSGTVPKFPKRVAKWPLEAIVAQQQLLVELLLSQ